MFRQAALFTVAVWLLAAATASAQGVLDRTVGPNGFGRPLEFRAFTAHELGALSQAAGVSIGFEALPPLPGAAAARPAIVLTGRTVRDAIAAMTALDPRYEAAEDAGVVVFRPADTGASPSSMFQPLDAPAPAVPLGETTGREALGLVASLLGAPRDTAVAFSDTKRFALDAPPGTVRSLLTAIVRAHGQLVWIFERSTGRQPMFPYSLMFMSGLHGWGLGVSGLPPAAPIDLTRFLRAPAPPANVADAIVGARGDGYPLVLTGMGASAARDLSAATRVPIGMQLLPRAAPRARFGAPEFTATGRTLREVLEILVATDDRYDWRIADGVVLIRPARAWGNADDTLFALVPTVELDDVPMTQAVTKVIAALGGPDQPATSFPDSKSVSLSVWNGTALDLLTALVKSHGSLTWTLEDAEPDEVRRTGLRHRVTLAIAGGVGLGVLVR